MVKIESDPLCKAHYFTHPQNGQTLAAYGDYALIDLTTNFGSFSGTIDDLRLIRRTHAPDKINNRRLETMMARDGDEI
jgi:hypothetical protein